MQTKQRRHKGACLCAVSTLGRRAGAFETGAEQITKKDYYQLWLRLLDEPQRSLRTQSRQSCTSLVNSNGTPAALNHLVSALDSARWVVLPQCGDANKSEAQ
eukprot:1248946-Amphidinium_carterae.2